jgi:hypothetical protein
MRSVDILKKIIEDERFARRLIENAIKMIKPEDFLNAMKSKTDPSKLILNHFHHIIENPA